MAPQCRNGFTLLEALIAAALLASAIITLSYVVIQASAQSVRSQRAVAAATLAQAKLEELRAAEFRFDPAGARVTSPRLASVSTDTLVDESSTHVELLDGFGATAPDGTVAVYRRRWSIAEAESDPDTLTIAVCVMAVDSRGPIGADACVWTHRTRQP
jgi:type II secretory pathway pseudopilin PulG